MDLFEEEDLADDTRATLVHFDDDTTNAIIQGGRGISTARSTEAEKEDGYYAGEPVSRNQLINEDSMSDMEYGDQEQEWSTECEDGDLADEMECGGGGSVGPQDDNTSRSPHDREPFMVPDVSADVAKGKVAKQQLEMWERLLEIRIHLQKMLTISNRLPVHDVHPLFVERGKQPASEATQLAEKQLMELMDKLLTVQRSLLLANPETEHIASACKTPSSQEPLSDQLSEMHCSLRGYCDHVITKWQDRMQLASGRVSGNKDFIRADQSVVTQIDHVMQDTPRLVKRSQLKRSHYKILGKLQQGSCDVSHDAHLRDYDEEVFDDDDFYHQLLQALINNKTKLTDTNDPISMGRQLLELQKLRRRAKKVVDTKASKGRKIRDDDVHSKLVNFMTPVYPSSGHMSDATKNELFSSLFR